MTSCPDRSSNDLPNRPRSRRSSVDWLRRLLAVGAGSIVTLVIAVLEGAALQMQSTVDVARPSRLAVVNHTLADYGVPFNHLTTIRNVEGVGAASFSDDVSGAYGGSRIEGIAVGEDYFAVFPEMAVESSELAFFHRTGEAILGGSQIATKHGWHTGDRLHLIGMSPRPFELAGVVGRNQTSWFAQRVFVHHPLTAHRNQFRVDQRSPPPASRVAKLHVLVDEGYSPIDVAKHIDAMFINTEVPTLTRTERQMVGTGVTHRVGGLRFFADAVFVSLVSLLLVGIVATIIESTDSRLRRCETLSASVRTHVAGKAIAEALCLCVVSAAIGLAVVHSVWPALSRQFDLPLSGPFQFLWAVGVPAALLIGLASSVFPATRAIRARIPTHPQD